MVKYIDSFGRETLVEILSTAYNKRIGFVLRKERQSIYDSWDLGTARKIVEDLQVAIQIIEEVK